MLRLHPRLLLPLIAGVFVVAACNQAAPASPKPAASPPPPAASPASVPVVASPASAPAAQTAPGTGSVLNRVQSSGTLRAGIRDDFPPVSFIDEQGKWVGFDVDLAEALAQRLGVTLEKVRVDETTRISLLQSGGIDAAIASMNHTRKREEPIDFSQTYFWTGQTFLVRKGTYTNLMDLSGKTVAMNKGSSAIDGWKKYAQSKGGAAGQIQEFGNKQQAIEAVRNGTVEGYGEDAPALLGLAGGDPNLVLVTGYFNPVQYGIGVPENDSEWRDAVNIALQDLWVDGTYAKIYEKWFGPSTRWPLPLGGQMEIWP